MISVKIKIILQAVAITQLLVLKLLDWFAQRANQPKGINSKRKMHESTFLLCYSSLSSGSIYALSRLESAAELTLERVTELSSKSSIERISLL